MRPLSELARIDDTANTYAIRRELRFRHNDSFWHRFYHIPMDDLDDVTWEVLAKANPTILALAKRLGAKRLTFKGKRVRGLGEAGVLELLFKIGVLLCQLNDEEEDNANVVYGETSP